MHATSDNLGIEHLFHGEIFPVVFSEKSKSPQSTQNIRYALMCHSFSADLIKNLAYAIVNSSDTWICKNMKILFFSMKNSDFLHRFSSKAFNQLLCGTQELVT